MAHDGGVVIGKKNDGCTSLEICLDQSLYLMLSNNKKDQRILYCVMMSWTTCEWIYCGCERDGDATLIMKLVL